MNQNQIISRDGYIDYPFPAMFPGVGFSAIKDLMDEVESMFSSPCVKKSFPYPMDVRLIYDKKTNEPIQYLIDIALAGFSKDEIKVKIVQNKALRVDIMPTDEQDYESDKVTFYPKYLSKGIAKREASYSWTLTPRIDAKNMLVKYSDGVLSIALPIITPKKEEVSDEVEVTIGD